ncbi:penicillin acylase family protein [Steroidobacter sp.]|uniref:penicillin acylase family protein n=1 Tax=Steroidobacter sp. TaxID=1978227 RepID=UPI001A39A6F4|nr:penicillin acylase family protein [Steroidobacter sp.]MBL8271885.1 penicillin acylase family protein [Steroidobacter sp.]
MRLQALCHSIRPLTLSALMMALPIEAFAQNSPDPAQAFAARAQAKLPQHEGKLKVSGLQKPVDVVRDQWGIPHIYAANTHDLFFAQGFIAAQDRMWNIELWRRNSDGRLAEVLGPKYLERDKFARVMKYRGDWDAELRKYHPEGKVIFTAFAAGVNAAIRAAIAADKVPVEFELSGFQPEPVWTAQTLLSRMPVWSITRNIASEVARALSVKTLGLEKTAEVTVTDPPTPLVLPEGLDLADINPAILALTRDANDFDFQMQPVIGGTAKVSANSAQLAHDSGIGSNNWVISGAKSSTGMPLLANDPHREVQNPALRYWVHLVAPGWNVIGATEPGMPGVTIGHNEHVGWGFTILNGDQQDLYVERTNPQNPNSYQYKGEWLPMKIDVEQIAVKGAATVRFEVKTTRHGPLLHEDTARQRAYAMRWSGYETGGHGYLGSLGLMQSRNWADFTKAAASAWYGHHSLVYADTQGNYGYVSTGLTPNRPNWNGLFPVPGHEGRYEWQGYIPTTTLPKELNGKRGFYASSNNNVFPSTFPGLTVPPFAFEYLTPYRYDRVVEVLSEQRKFDIHDMSRLQADVVSLPARRLVPLLKGLRSEKPEVSRALATLAEWNFHVDVDSVAATIYEYWLLKLNPLTYAKKLPEAARGSARYDMRRLISWLEQPDQDFGPNPAAGRDEVLLVALEQAIAAIKQQAGDDPSRWAWGNLHQARFIHPLANGEVATLAAIPPVPRGGDSSTVQLTGGATAKGADQGIGASVMFVLDVQDWDRSLGLNTPGNESQLGSRHYSDLAARWGRNEPFPIAFSAKKVKEVSRTRITLQP